KNVCVKIVNKQHDGAKDDVASGVAHSIANLFFHRELTGFHQLHSMNEIWRELLSGTGVFALQDNAADMD
ncbi:MAG: hypothetical protein E7K08_16380, partial [Citrobacter freundii]|nr:hypothetical protein [Citrobacter freundii]